MGFFQLLRFSDKTDKLVMIIGGIAASINGFSVPLFALIFGEMADAFGPQSTA